jgi:hypothetical protein
MYFNFSTPVLIRRLWQLKTAVLLHWWVIRAVPLGCLHNFTTFINTLSNIERQKMNEIHLKVSHSIISMFFGINKTANKLL